jgi:hypothetical protein
MAAPADKLTATGFQEDPTMPPANGFRHQSYAADGREATCQVIRPCRLPQTTSREFHRRMVQVGAEYRAADVRAIYLAHGSFVGSDATGVLSELARAMPDASQRLRRAARRAASHVVGDHGNFTEHYAWLFDTAINASGASRIPVRLFDWSGENHHLGRADGAIRLLAELAAREFEPGARVQLWGHSHAGNVFALATNLLAASPEHVERFFAAAEVYYRWPLFGWIDIPVWQRVRQLLLQRPGPLDNIRLDIATFGTPIRYGWDSDGYEQLLHFVHRRQRRGAAAARAEFPPKPNDVLTAADGDYVQQLGIAGTNVMPSVLAWRAWIADRRLNDLLQGDLPEKGVLERLACGAIVPDEGTTLLVDYGPARGRISDHHAGHAVYTRPEWLLFHAEEIARQFYAAAPMAEVA